MQVAWRQIIDDLNANHCQGYLLCVSGGVDSMFMLDFFKRNCRKPFRAAHFNHGLRASADADEDFVRARCAAVGVGFISGKGDPDLMRAASSLEAEARRQRYAFLDGELPSGNLLVTAHHANDQLETVVMRLMRGLPDDQLRMRRLDRIRFKPFLSVPKDEIVRQAQARGLEWIEDETNADLRHERNWVRHVLVPQMMERRNVLLTIGMRGTGSDDETPEAAPFANC